MRTVDCRGLSCPQPVLMFTKANKESDTDPIDVLVDNPASVENVTRAAKKKGWMVNAKDDPGQGEGVVRLELRK